VKNEKAMNSIALGLSSNNKWMILLGKDTGRWLWVLPSPVNGMELLAQEFRGSVLKTKQASVYSIDRNLANSIIPNI
jgi:hypothetical protein